MKQFLCCLLSVWLRRGLASEVVFFPASFSDFTWKAAERPPGRKMEKEKRNKQRSREPTKIYILITALLNFFHITFYPLFIQLLKLREGKNPPRVVTFQNIQPDSQ